MDNENEINDVLADGLPRILPPYEDGIFKTLLTMPESNAILVGSVSAFMERKLMSATLRNNDIPSRDITAKREKFDVNCVVDSEDGDQCDVEMQASPLEGDSLIDGHTNIKWRSVFNLCDLHSNQAGIGRRYSKFVRSYQIMLYNFKVFTNKNKPIERFTFRNDQGMELCDAVTAIFIDLTQAKEIAKKNVIEMSDIESWIVFFALANKPQYKKTIEEIAKQREVISLARDALLNISQSPSERARFRSRRMWQQDREHERAVFLEEGAKKAREEYEIILANKDAEIAKLRAMLYGQ